jgi:hypothetical protein
MDDPGAGATSGRKLLISPKIEGKNEKLSNKP